MSAITSFYLFFRIAPVRPIPAISRNARHAYKLTGSPVLGVAAVPVVLTSVVDAAVSVVTVDASVVLRASVVVDASVVLRSSVVVVLLSSVVSFDESSVVSFVCLPAIA